MTTEVEEEALTGVAARTEEAVPPTAEEPRRTAEEAGRTAAGGVPRTGVERPMVAAPAVVATVEGTVVEEEAMVGAMEVEELVAEGVRTAEAAVLEAAAATAWDPTSELDWARLTSPSTISSRSKRISTLNIPTLLPAVKTKPISGALPSTLPSRDTTSPNRCTRLTRLPCPNTSSTKSSNAALTSPLQFRAKDGPWR